MYKGKFLTKSLRRRLTGCLCKMVCLVLCLMLLVNLSVPGTYALLIDHTEPIINTFVLGDITYKLTLIANPPAGYETTDVTMPDVTPGNEQQVNAGHADFDLSGAPVLEDYEFLGWYPYSDSGDQLFAADADVITVGYGDPYTETNGDEVSLTLYAHWTPLTKYTITYHGNGSEELPATFTDSKTEYVEYKTHDRTYIISYNRPVRSQYTWVEWNTKADGTGDRYLSGMQYTENKNLDLYAIWEPDIAAYADFENPWLWNMEEVPENWSVNYGIVEGAGEIYDDYSGEIHCTTMSGRDALAIPIYDLEVDKAYRLHFSVDFGEFGPENFYSDNSNVGYAENVKFNDRGAYIFGATIFQQPLIVTGSGITKNSSGNGGYTNPDLNMMWSTEQGGKYISVTMEFVATATTMYWTWETTDIVDGTEMTYIFDNYYIVETQIPQPRVEFDNMYATFSTYPFNGVQNGDDSGLPEYNNGSCYFHVEQFDFDSVRFRLFGYSGSEFVYAPITGLTKGQTYTISFVHDGSDATYYNNGKYMYGFAVTNTASPVSNSSYQSLTNVNGNVSLTFTAQASSMYLQIKCEDLCNRMWSTVSISDVTIQTGTSSTSVEDEIDLENPGEVEIGLPAPEEPVDEILLPTEPGGDNETNNVTPPEDADTTESANEDATESDESEPTDVEQTEPKATDPVLDGQQPGIELPTEPGEDGEDDETVEGFEVITTVDSAPFGKKSGEPDGDGADNGGGEKEENP